MRWHCSSDTEFEIRALVVWSRARYLSVTEAPNNTESLRVSEEETFCFFETLKNKLNRALGHFCDMNKMTLPSRHRIRKSNPGGLRLRTRPLGYGGSPQYWIFTSERGRNISFLWNMKKWNESGFRPLLCTYRLNWARRTSWGWWDD